MADEMKISKGPGSVPVVVVKPVVPDVVGDGGNLKDKLKKYNKDGKQGYY